MNAFYSTPSLYTDQKKKDKSVKWEVRGSRDDIFPLADNSHNYWSGYFTSRPALKRQVRFATNLLMAARQLEVVSNVTAADVDLPTERPSPPVGTSWTDSLEGTVGVATHHDGMSGTERQDVSDDYEQRISESSFEVEAGVSLSLARLLGLPASGAKSIEHCNCNLAGNCLNMTVCAATTGTEAFAVVAWNPLAHSTASVVRLPVSGASGWAVTDGSGKAVASQVLALDNRTKELPLLYLNSFNMTAQQKAAALAELANKADHVLVFQAALPAMGYATFHATRKAGASGNATAPVVAAVAVEAAGTVENDVWSLSFDESTGLLKSVTNKASGATTELSVSWGW